VYVGNTILCKKSSVSKHKIINFKFHFLMTLRPWLNFVKSHSFLIVPLSSYDTHVFVIADKGAPHEIIIEIII